MLRGKHRDLPPHLQCSGAFGDSVRSYTRLETNQRCSKGVGQAASAQHIPSATKSPGHPALPRDFSAACSGPYAPSLPVSNTQLCWEHVGAPQDSARQLRVHVPALHKSPVCVRAGTRHLSWEQPYCFNFLLPGAGITLGAVPAEGTLQAGWGPSCTLCCFALGGERPCVMDGTRVKRGFVPREPEGSGWCTGTLWQESCTAGVAGLVFWTKGNRGYPKKFI